MEEEPLHAFPDHLVMLKLLSGIRKRQLSVEEALSRIYTDPNWTPVAIDPEKLLIFFLNIGKHRLARWQSVYSIADIARLVPESHSFSAPFDLLRVLTDGKWTYNPRLQEDS